MSMAKRPTIEDAHAVEEIVKATLAPFGRYPTDFRASAESVRFDISEPLTFKMMQALADVLGTEMINFCMGENAWSDVTPGEAGYIEVLWPIPAIMKKEGTK
jgi:hypothetical protein